MKRPETIENRWDILYRDFPEIYDEFAAVPKKPNFKFEDMFNVRNKVVVDVGSGSGLSSFRLASVAQKVVGVEIQDEMRKLAEANAQKQGITNVDFIKGDARQLPLPDNSVDVVLGMTLAIYPPESFANFIKEAKRVVRPGGVIASYDIAPDWYGGDLDSVISQNNGLKVTDNKIVDDIFKQAKFQYKDIYQDQDYGSLEKIIRTYGFIFGKNAINYIRQNNKTTIRWKFRVHYLNT